MVGEDFIDVNGNVFLRHKLVMHEQVAALLDYSLPCTMLEFPKHHTTLLSSVRSSMKMRDTEKDKSDFLYNEIKIT